MIYSIIFSYSRDGIQWYQAPADYIATCVGASVSTVKECLKKLLTKQMLVKKSAIYRGSVERVYYQAVVPDYDQYQNGTGKVELPVPKRYGCTSTETVLNNTKINTSIKKPSSTTPTRRSLISKPAENKPKATKRDKFISSMLAVSEEFEFATTVSEQLFQFFTMLSQTDAYLPEITVRAQLEDIYNLTERQQLEVISDTIKSGWKSLKYSADRIRKGETASFDTAKPGAFQPKDPKNDKRKEQYEDDEVF